MEVIREVEGEPKFYRGFSLQFHEQMKEDEEEDTGEKTPIWKSRRMPLLERSDL